MEFIPIIVDFLMPYATFRLHLHFLLVIL